MDKKTGLFFGSFNPIHTGHLIIANFMVTKTDLDEVWFVVSPQNPLKKQGNLAPERQRQDMVEMAIEDNPHLRCSDIEFYMPKPSYTIDTMIYLREKYPEKNFALIMGGDNLRTIHKWKNYELLLRDYEIYLYSRPGNPIHKSIFSLGKVHQFESPYLGISSTYIRKCLQKGHSIRYLVPEVVFKYLNDYQMY